ncbi:MAG: hypothetical protein VKM98_08655 [Cyanobacteriota bacterium]|nr:hypothetical protein [Cyanobacteriota bacterium]
MVGALMSQPAPAAAGPVNWIEVEPTAAGRQWWDSGSLHTSRNGLLSVLSRFQPAQTSADTDQSAGSQRPGELYVMEIDCGQRLYRDTSVNGLPRWGAEWQADAGDGLIAEVIAASCTAAGLQPT